MLTQRATWPKVQVLAGLVLMIAANYLFRRVLERPDLRLYDFVKVFHPVAENAFRTGHYSVWRLFLPVRELGGSWTTTDLVVTDFFVHRFGPAGTWYLFNALLIAASFATSWFVFRSAVFSYTFALCMGFGTQLYHVYAVSGGIGAPLLFIYYELVLLTAYGVVSAVSRRGLYAWAGAFAFAMALMVMAYEGWLDFLVFACVATAAVGPALWRTNRVQFRRLMWMASSLVVLGAVYVWIKVHIGYGQGAGAESDVIFNYAYMAPMVEDFISNCLTHLYIAVTNFLPPAFLSSTALYSIGAAQLVAEQHGYHAPFSFLVPMHYIFMWRYAAGAVAVIFVYVLVKAVKSLWTSPSMTNAVVTLCLLLIGVGGPTHAMVKIRPMKTVPVVGYHTILGVLGAALLIAFGLMYVEKNGCSRVRSFALTGAVWIVILYGALTRPAMLSHLAAQAGLGEGLYPDPWRAAELRLGIPITRPGGDEPYLLQVVTPSGYSSQHIEARSPEWFVALRQRMPAAPAWQVVAGRTAPAAEGHVRVHGDSVPGRMQFVSPRLDLSPHWTVRMRLDVMREQGRVCVGIYDRAADKWIVTPEILAQEYEFDSGSGQDVRVAITNCDMRLSENPDSIFQVGFGSYEPVEQAPVQQ